MDKVTTKKAVNKARSTAIMNHPLLNKWLSADIINYLPDETAQAIADLIQAAVKRRKQSVNAHTRYESRCGVGKTVSLNIERLREALLREGGVNCDEQKQPEHK